MRSLSSIAKKLESLADAVTGIKARMLCHFAYNDYTAYNDQRRWNHSHTAVIDSVIASITLPTSGYNDHCARFMVRENG